MGCHVRTPLKNPNLKMFYYTSGNTQIRVAFTAAMMKLKGAKIPPTIVFPIQLQNQRVRDSCVKGYPQLASGDVAHPAEPAPPDVPVGGMGNENLSQNTMSSPGPASPLVLSLRGVSKAFGAVQALRDVSVDCRAGEIHALVGENGSGKSTLLGIASGFVASGRGSRRDRRAAPAARLSCRGSEARPRHRVSDLLARPRPVGGREPLSRRARGRADRSTGAWRSGRRRGSTEFKLDVPLTAAAGSLSLAERQLLEVVKALLAQPKVLLLDEPTTALGPEDVERLHALVLEQSRAGVGIVYVSHRLPEVLGIADRVTVLRDGVGQGTFEAAAMSEESLVALMIGRPLQLAFPERHDRRTPSARCCSPSRACAASDSARSTSTSRGARSSGSQAPRATARCSSSVRSPVSSARPAAPPATAASSTRGRRSAPLRAGVVLLSGDRARESLFPVLSVRANTTIQVLRRLGRLGLPAPPA